MLDRNISGALAPAKPLKVKRAPMASSASGRAGLLVAGQTASAASELVPAVAVRVRATTLTSRRHVGATAVVVLGPEGQEGGEHQQNLKTHCLSPPSRGVVGSVYTGVCAEA